MAPSVDEVAELIAEGTSAPVFMAGSVALSASIFSARHIQSASTTVRALEPTASASEVGLTQVNNRSSLEALTAPLSVENVAGVQCFTNEDVKKATKRDVALDPRDAQSSGEGKTDKGSASGPKLIKNDAEKGLDGMTEEERQKVEDLKRRDAKVRAHEQAHSAIGGSFASAPRFRFVRGPDGKFYAVAGEVTIDTSAVPGNPQATIRKMQQVKRAALAPQEPSAQDRRVAAEAESKIMQARKEIRDEENEQVRKAQEKKQRQEAEAQGLGRSIIREQAPDFDPEARFRSSLGGTGPAPGTGLAGAGGLDVDASDVIDPKSLFGLVA